MDSLIENEYLQRRKEEFKGIFIKCAKMLGISLFIWLLGYFGFSMSWVILLILIITTSAYFKEKFKEKKTFGRNISRNEKEAVLATMKDMPSWVFFPDVEKAEWLNKIISQMWPFIGSYVKDFVMYELQPLLEEHLPAIAKPFRFSKLDLGDMSPRVGGIKTYTGEKIRRDEIVMDVEFYLYSDAGIKVNVRGINSGVKDFQIRGTLRVLCRPLIPRFPLVGAVTVCFINNPYINFDLTNMGSLLEVPGIGEIFRGVLEDIIASILVLPNRYSVPLVKEIELSQLRHPLPQGVLRIHAISARDLIGADFRVFQKKTSDPYCILKVGAQKFQTEVIKSNLNPTWDEYFEAIVDQRIGQCLELLVYDKDTMQKGDFLGRYSVEIEDVYRNGTVDEWFPLIGVKRGSVHLKLTWHELNSDSRQFDKTMADNRSLSAVKNYKLSSGFLYVVVDSAKNLKPVTKSEEPSPMGVIRLGNQVKKLKLLKDSTNPVWEKVCHFFVGNPEVEQLQISLFDRNEDNVLGKCQISLEKLLKEENMMMERAFFLKDSPRPDACIYLRLALRAFRKGFKVTSPSDASLSSTTAAAGGSGGVTPGGDANNGTSNNINADLSTEIHHRDNIDFIPGALDPNVPFKPRSSLQRRGDKSDSPDTESVLREQSSVVDSPSSELNSPGSPIRRLTSLSPIIMTDSAPSSPSMNSTSHLDLPAVEQLDIVHLRMDPNDHSSAHHGLLRLSLNYSKPKRVLSVVVHQAKNLVALDADGVSDPFVVLKIVPKKLLESYKMKTRIVKNTLNPQFDETFQFTVESRYLSQCILEAHVRNHIGFFNRGVKEMGLIRLKLRDSLANTEVIDWYEIQAPANESRNSLARSGSRTLSIFNRKSTLKRPSELPSMSTLSDEASSP